MLVNYSLAAQTFQYKLQDFTEYKNKIPKFFCTNMSHFL